MAKRRNKMGTIYPHKIQETIHGVAGEKVQTGYHAVPVERKEGDTWKDSNGKEWEKLNGIVASIPKFKDVRVPLFCPNCNKVMGRKPKDSEVYYKFGFCFECLIDRDAQLIRDGQMDDYAKKYITSKQFGYYTDMKLQIDEYMKDIEKGYIEFPTEDGKLEKWTGDMGRLKDFCQKELDFVNSELVRLDKNEKKTNF